MITIAGEDRSGFSVVQICRMEGRSLLPLTLVFPVSLFLFRRMSADDLMSCKFELLDSVLTAFSDGFFWFCLVLTSWFVFYHCIFLVYFIVFSFSLVGDCLCVHFRCPQKSCLCNVLLCSAWLIVLNPYTHKISGVAKRGSPVARGDLKSWFH